MSQIYHDLPQRTFIEETPGELDDKEHYALKLGAAENTVTLSDDAASTIGYSRGKLQDGQDAVNVSLIGATEKVIAGGAIAKGARIKSDANGKLVAASSGDRSTGIKLTHGTSADGDIIEVIRVVETAP